MQTPTFQGKFISAFITAVVVVSVLWLVKGIEWYFNYDFSHYGIYPRSWEHLPGILLMPFIHGDFAHLLSNSPAIFVLTILMCWMYPRIYIESTLIIWIVGGAWTWIIGRESYHVGASGLIYGYVSFIFFAGIISRNFKMLAISMLVVFLYGSLIWGIFPLQPRVSWEAHLTGFISGLIAAFIFRDKLPKKEKFRWEDEPEEENESYPYWENTSSDPLIIQPPPPDPPEEEGPENDKEKS